MRMNKKTKTICNYCQTQFEKDDREFRSNKLLGKPNYCSRRCSGKANYKNIERLSAKPKLLKRTKDQIFSRYIRAAKRRSNGINFDTKYLEELWNKQEGKCIYSKVLLNHPLRTERNDIRYTASLDRIDSSKDYVQGNLQFISIAMNYMKAEMSHEQTLELISIIKT